MTNLLILFNPYYQKDVVVSHVNVLLSSADQQNAKVAFGKIRSKLRSNESYSLANISHLKEDIAKNGYIQLFLTDYADMYVAKVIDVTNENSNAIAPSYYADKNLDVEAWFVFTDIRQIVDNDFQTVRDRILGNMTTPSFGNHHYAVYGNNYQFPLEIEMDNPIDYFADAQFPYYIDIFKSTEYIETKHDLIRYRFGEDIFHSLHPNSQESIISAEIEYTQNRRDSLYDFSAVVIKYAKAAELELYLFFRKLMIFLMDKKTSLESVEYRVQSVNYHLSDLKNSKPNIGTYKYLLSQPDIRDAISTYITNTQLRIYLQHELRHAITTIQDIRNESAHGTPTPLRECETMRANIIGIGKNGLLSDLMVNKKRG